MRRPRPPVLAAGAAALALALVGWRLLTRSAPIEDPQVLTLEARATALATQVSLARSDSLHLVLEPDRGTLTLHRGAAPLRTWVVREVRVGARRFAGSNGGWHLEAYTGGTMTPTVRRERRVVVSDQVEPPDPSGAETEIPPTPEEAVPAPGRFVIRFAPGLGLEVVSADEPEGPAFPFARRAAHAFWRLLPGSRDRLRIRVEMDAAEAGSLYRSFPEGAAFVLIPG